MKPPVRALRRGPIGDTIRIADLREGGGQVLLSKG